MPAPRTRVGTFQTGQGQPSSRRMEQAEALGLLKGMLGPGAEFREGQWEAIDLVANQRQRLLVVQRTGWGKSVVYFLATRFLRDLGAGCTFLISPLLSLMRNQIAAARNIGVRAETINSTNEADTEPQKTRANSFQQAQNLAGAFAADQAMIRPEPVLLIDDMVDSRWTFTVLTMLLRNAGSGPVFPFALADSSSEDGD